MKDFGAMTVLGTQPAIPQETPEIRVTPLELQGEDYVWTK